MKGNIWFHHNIAYQTWLGPDFMRFEAVIAFRWPCDDTKVLAVEDEGCNKSISGNSWITEYFHCWSLIFASISPTRRAAAPTSRKPCVWKSWRPTKSLLVIKERNNAVSICKTTYIIIFNSIPVQQEWLGCSSATKKNRCRTHCALYWQNIQVNQSELKVNNEHRYTFLWQNLMLRIHAIANLECQRIYTWYHIHALHHQPFHLLMILNQAEYGFPLIQYVLCWEQLLDSTEELGTYSKTMKVKEETAL